MIRILVFFSVLSLLAGCGGSSSSDSEGSQAAARSEANAGSKGVGPITHVSLGPIDPAVADSGQAVFDSKCAVCHKIEERYVGPAIAGVTDRREPEWILNMILNPEGMLKEDATAKELFTQYLTPMTFQNVSEEEAKAILMYFRSVDAGAAR